MALYHLQVKTLSRSTGRTAPAAAAYRSGTRIVTELDGREHDYTRRSGVESVFILTPEGADWAQDRSALWNAAEAAEKRKDAKLSREYELGLPHEIDADGRRALAEGFAREVVTRFGVVADVAIHAPHRHGDERNHHAHVMTTTRAVTADGLGDKTRDLDSPRTSGPLVESLRELWATQVNAALERIQAEARVDHRSYARQGDGRHAGQHLGPAATVLERAGVQTRIGDVGREAAAHNASLDATLAEQRAMLDRQIERAQQREASERRLSTGRAALGISPGRPDEGAVRSTRLDAAAMHVDDELDRYVGAPSGSAAVTRGTRPNLVPSVAPAREAAHPEPSPATTPAHPTGATLDAAALEALQAIEARMAARAQEATEAAAASARAALREEASRAHLAAVAAAARTTRPGPAPTGPRSHVPDRPTDRPAIPPRTVTPPAPVVHPDPRALAIELAQAMKAKSDARMGSPGGLQPPPRVPREAIATPGQGQRPVEPARTVPAAPYTAAQAERILREGGVVRVSADGVGAVFRTRADELHGRGEARNRGGLFGMGLDLHGEDLLPRLQVRADNREIRVDYGIADLARILARLARQAADAWIARLRLATTQSGEREERAAAAARQAARERAAAPPTPPIGTEAAAGMLRGDGVIQVDKEGRASFAVKTDAPATERPGLHGIEAALTQVGATWSRKEAILAGWHTLKVPVKDLAIAIGRLAKPAADRWIERLAQATKESGTNFVTFKGLAKDSNEPAKGSKSIRKGTGLAG